MRDRFCSFMSPRDDLSTLVLDIPSGPRGVLSGYAVVTNMAVVNDRIVERVQGEPRETTDYQGQWECRRRAVLS